MSQRNPAADARMAQTESEKGTWRHGRAAELAAGITLALLAFPTPGMQGFTQSANHAPAITSAISTSFLIGSLNSFPITSTGSPTPSLAATGALPTGVTLSNTGNGTATLSGSPAAGSAGTYSLAIKASNGATPAANQTFTLSVIQAPTLTTPLNGAALGGLSAFRWNPSSPAASAYVLRVGIDGPGTGDLYSSKLAGTLTTAAVNIPQNGVTVYVTLYYEIGGVYRIESSTFMEKGSPTQPTLTSPAAGAVLSGPTSFTWRPGTGVQLYELALGLGGPGTSDLYLSGALAGSVTSRTINIPSNGATVYVTLYADFNDSWTVGESIFLEAGTISPPVLTSPGAGIRLSGLTAFSWQPGQGISDYALMLGTTGPLTSDLYYSGVQPNSVSSLSNVSIPAQGKQVYASLGYATNGTWNWAPYTFMEGLSTLSVGAANPAGTVSIAVTPSDNAGQGAGTAPFTRSYPSGTSVILTAPAKAAGYPFSSWSGCTSASGLGCSVTMTGAAAVTANYAVPTYTLTVSSSHPSNGAVIGVSQADINGAAAGPASYVRTYLGGTTVTLTAPSNVKGSPFLAWSGCTSAVGTACTATLDSNMSVQANYTVLFTQGSSRQVSNGGLVTGLSTQAIWRLRTNGTTGTVSSPSDAIPYSNLPFTISGTGTPCDGKRFTSTSAGNVVTFNTTLDCMYDLWATNFGATLSYNGWTSYVTGISSTPNGAGGNTVTVNVRDYYPQTSGLAVAGGTGVPAGSTITIAGTGTACDGAQSTINAQGTANQFDYGITGYQDMAPYKIQITSASACSFHNAANVGRMAYMGRDSAGSLYMFGDTGGYDNTVNPFYGEPTTLQIRKSTDGGNTWSAPVTLFADNSGQCNNDTDNCEFYAESFVQAPNGTFVLWHHLYNWYPGPVSSEFGYSTCNPNTADCTRTASWKAASYPFGPPGGGAWHAGGLFGFTMPNGTDIAVGFLSGSGPGTEYLLISHDNGGTWPDSIPVTDGGPYADLPTNESVYLSFGTDSILGFVRNGLSYPGCENSPPNYQCGSPNGAGGLLMMYSRDDGATWTIEPVTIPQAQPLCGGIPGTSVGEYAYVTPLLVPSTQRGMVTLTFGERQYCTGSVTVSYLRAVTFDPAVVAAHPESIGNAQTLDSTRSEYIDYGGMVQLGPSSFILSYEKGSSIPWGVVSQNVLTATQP